jgi:hypothetical protein
VQDNGVGLTRGTSPTGRGIGLTVLRERLRELHGSDAALRLTEASGGGTITEVELPRRVAMPTSGEQHDSEHEDVLEGATPSASPARTIFAITAGWALFAAFWVQQSWGYARVRSSGRAVPLLEVLQRDLPIVACWALLTPLVFAGTRALARSPWPRGIVILLHLATAPAFAAAHLAGLSFLRHGVPWMNWSTGLFTIDLLVYAVLVALSQRRVLEATLVERATTAAQLEAAVFEAGLAATTQRVGSNAVLRALDSLADTALRDAAAAERGLARLAELVRATLDMVGASAVSLDRELDALEAYVLMRQTALAEPVSIAVTCEPGVGAPMVRPGLLRALAEDLLRVASSGTIALMARDGSLIIVGTGDERRPPRALVAVETGTFSGPGVIVTDGPDGIVIIVSDAAVSDAPSPSSHPAGESPRRTLVA